MGEFVASDEPFFDRARLLWSRTTEPDARPYLRLFFEVYAAALREPARYEHFLSSAVAGWLALIRPMLEDEGFTADEATTVATELLALHHGCTLDLLATGDAARVGGAYLGRVAELEARTRSRPA